MTCVAADGVSRCAHRSRSCSPAGFDTPSPAGRAGPPPSRTEAPSLGCPLAFEAGGHENCGAKQAGSHGSSCVMLPSIPRQEGVGQLRKGCDGRPQMSSCWLCMHYDQPAIRTGWPQSSELLRISQGRTTGVAALQLRCNGTVASLRGPRCFRSTAWLDSAVLGKRTTKSSTMTFRRRRSIANRRRHDSCQLELQEPRGSPRSPRRFSFRLNLTRSSTAKRSFPA